ncbi:hypothetical protein BLS_006312 [Venturia inaequalis]|uniref:DUF7726 domain-containing protein n=1 Tax=Venturia inaequalis TaxID=5025 RepID=A0A8H3YPT0_VENIN|nr:hypothetical protein BLS_006312 [Venturia inaequalis]
MPPRRQPLKTVEASKLKALESLVNELPEDVVDQTISNTKKRKSSTLEDAEPSKPKKCTKKSPPAEEDEEDVLDLSSITLPGEESHEVEVYDTCNMIRSKIAAFLKAHPKETKASLARRINALPYVNNVNARNLGAFMAKNGYDSGNTSEAFYAAYVYFEKLRIKQGKPKSKDRLEMERVWGDRGGFNITTIGHNKGIIMRVGEGFSKPNKYGETTLHFNSGKTQKVAF